MSAELSGTHQVRTAAESSVGAAVSSSSETAALSLSEMAALSSSEVAALSSSETGAPPSPETEATATLGSLPLGARLVLRCRKDWRTAAVAAFEPDLARVVLSVASPSGHTYRVRRPADAPLTLDGPIPILGGGSWRPGLVRYDLRW